MKFLLVSLLTLAIASASVISRKNVDLMDDGTVVIRGDHGKIMKIFKEDGVHGETKVEIQVTGPNNIMKKIEIDEQNRVSVENGDQYDIPLTQNNQDNFEGDRSKRSFMFGKKNEVQDATIYDVISPSVDSETWKTMLINNNIDTKLINDLVMNRLTEETGHETNPTMFKTMIGQMKGMNWPNMNLDINRKTSNMMTMKILMRMLKQQVMMQMLDLYGMDQRLNELILDKILTTRGVFDKEVLMELIHDSFLRNLMVKQRIFDNVVLDMLMNRPMQLNLLDQVVNRQAMKNWMVNFGCCNKDILRRMVQETMIENMITNEKMDHMWLLKVLEDSMLSQVLMKKGIFNEDIMKKCLHNMRLNMLPGEYLLKQLINRHMLKIHLMQQGFIDINMLNRMMDNEILGLKVLLNVLTMNETPKMTYRQMMVDTPEWMVDQKHIVPMVDDMVESAMEKNMMRPIMVMDQFNTMRYPVTSNVGIWDILSMQGQDLNRQMMMENMNNIRRRKGLSNQMSMVNHVMME